MVCGLGRCHRLRHANIFDGVHSRHFCVLRRGQRRRKTDTATAGFTFKTVRYIGLAGQSRCIQLKFRRGSHLVNGVMRLLGALVHTALRMNRRRRKQQ